MIEYSGNNEEEYDPMAPNVYELLLAEETRRNRQLSCQTYEYDKRPSGAHTSPLNRNEDKSLSNHKIESKGVTISPHTDLSIPVTNNDGRTNYISGASTGPGNFVAQRSTIDTTLKLDGSSKAAKIMQKMGYKAGLGLGRDSQGISKPLEVERSGINSGRIIAAEPAIEPTITEQQKPAAPELNATNVLLLQNMVGPGEVDDDLEAETKEECKKYGHVIKCLIYEMRNKKVPDEEAVRIFVEFTRTESAVKAANDLNGRYFGGRIVRASFYSPERFARYELGPTD